MFSRICWGFFQYKCLKIILWLCPRRFRYRTSPYYLMVVLLPSWAKNKCRALSLFGISLSTSPHKEAMHDSDVQWASWRIKSLAIRLFIQELVQANNKQTWNSAFMALCEEIQRVSNAESVSMSWRLYYLTDHMNPAVIDIDIENITSVISASPVYDGN